MMRHLSIRLAVALVTFVIGLKLAWLVAALFSPAVTSEEIKGIYVAPPAVKKRSCPTSQRLLDAPPHPPLAPPAAVAEPAAPRQSRVVIRRSDGSVQVIETQRVQK